MASSVSMNVTQVVKRSDNGGARHAGLSASTAPKLRRRLSCMCRRFRANRHRSLPCLGQASASAKLPRAAHRLGYRSSSIVPCLGLSENSNLDIRHENESGKSSKFLSFICPSWPYLRYDRLANFGGVEFSDSPCLYYAILGPKPSTEKGSRRGSRSRN